MSNILTPDEERRKLDEYKKEAQKCTLVRLNQVFKGLGLDMKKLNSYLGRTFSRKPTKKDDLKTLVLDYCEKRLDALNSTGAQDQQTQDDQEQAFQQAHNEQMVAATTIKEAVEFVHGDDLLYPLHYSTGFPTLSLPTGHRFNQTAKEHGPEMSRERVVKDTIRMWETAGGTKCKITCKCEAQYNNSKPDYFLRLDVSFNSFLRVIIAHSFLSSWRLPHKWTVGPESKQLAK